MNTATLLRRSWESWISSDLERAGPYWLQIVWTGLFSVALAAVFTLLGFLRFARTAADWLDLPRWSFWYGNNLAACLIVAYLIHALFEGIGWWIGGPQRIRRFNSLQRATFFAGVPMLGVALGWPVSAWLLSKQGLDLFRGPTGWRTAGYSIGLTLLTTFVLYHWFGAKAKAIEADEAARRTLLPPLLLQPLVENAVHHGLEPQVEGGEVVVAARREADALLIEVRDSGRGLAAPARRGAGLAQANIRERLAAQFGPSATLELVDAPVGAPGIIARLRIPSPVLRP